MEVWCRGGEGDGIERVGLMMQWVNECWVPVSHDKLFVLAGVLSNEDGIFAYNAKEV